MSNRLYESVYRIVGIYETGQPFEDGAAVVLLEDAQAINGKPRQVNAFLLKVREGSDVARLRQRIEQRFEHSGEPLTATTAADFQGEQDMLQYVRVFTWTVCRRCKVLSAFSTAHACSYEPWARR